MFNMIIFLTLAIANAQSMDPAVAPSTGGGSGTSCLDRTGPICTFNYELCCETEGSFLTVPGISAAISCKQAKTRYNSINSAGYTDQQCLNVKSDIETNAGLVCTCVVDETAKQGVRTHFFN